MKAWLKGGLIGAGSVVFLIVINFILPRGEFGNLGSFLLLILSIPIQFIFNQIGIEGIPLAILLFILTPLFYFLIGSLFGLITEKLNLRIFPL